LAYLLVLPGSRASIVRCGGRYDPQLVKRSSEWVSEHIETPRSSATVPCREKLTDIGNSLALGLQCGVHSISLSAVHPVTCSLLWVRCLFDWLLILDFGGKWKFSKMSLCIPRRDTEVHFVTKFGENWPLRSCWKVAWIITYKKTWVLQDSSQPPFCPKWTDCTQNPWTLSPLDMSTYTEFGQDQLRFARLIPERLIFRPKKTQQYRLSAYNKGGLYSSARKMHANMHEQYSKKLTESKSKHMHSD